jgi:hypothetical protein
VRHPQATLLPLSLEGVSAKLSLNTDGRRATFGNLNWQVSGAVMSRRQPAGEKNFRLNGKAIAEFSVLERIRKIIPRRSRAKAIWQIVLRTDNPQDICTVLADKNDENHNRKEDNELAQSDAHRQF